MTRLSPRVRALGILLCLALLSSLAPIGEAAGQSAGDVRPPAKIALTGGKIIPVRGSVIEEGTVLIENGRITAVGSSVELPYDATEIDCTGKVLFPGMIDPFNWRGLDIPNEALAVSPYLDVYDALDPSRIFFEETLRNGITAVHISPSHNLVIGAVTRVVRPIGLTPEEMTLRTPVAIQLATTPRRGSDRMQQLADLRGAFRELDAYLGTVAERRYEEEREKAGESVDVPPAEAREKGRSLVRDIDLDDAHRNLHRLRQGAMKPWFYCGAATDVAPAIEIARAEGLVENSVLLIGNDAHRAVAEIAASKRPVICPVDLVARSRDPFTGELSETFVPKVLHEAGVPFALQPNPDGSLAERYLTYQAARCVRAGIPREEALRAITLNPARFLGLGDQIGSIEAGKRGDIVVFSGDPLDFSSWVEEVYIDGMLAYDRARDHRLDELVGPLSSEDEGAGDDEDENKADDNGGSQKKSDDANDSEGRSADRSRPSDGGGRE